MGVVRIEYLFKLKERELIQEETSMSGYFLRKQILDVKDLEWRKAKQSEIDLFLKKVQEVETV